MSIQHHDHSAADHNLGLNVAQAFRNTSESRRLLAKLRGDVLNQNDTKSHSTGLSNYMPSSTNSHRKYSLEEYSMTSNAVFQALFETATISVLELRISVGEMVSIAFHDGIGSIMESLTIDEHDQRNLTEDTIKTRANNFLIAKEWTDLMLGVPTITLAWPYEVLLEMIQCFKSNVLVTDSILMMWHLHTLNLRKINSSVLSKHAFTAQTVSKQDFSRSSFPLGFDEDLFQRISNRRRLSRGVFLEFVSEAVSSRSF
jgi:hypothetical protein